MIPIILVTSVISLLMSSFVFWRLLPKRKKRGSSVLVDTSGLMDGRINEVVKSGFVPAELLIPRFVIAELQLLADKSDHLKRERARFGLQVIQDLQASRQVDVAIISDNVASEPGVDEKLVAVALKRGALLYTTDYNLLKVAEIAGVRVLNINELAQNLRPTQLPGEQSEIKIVGKGQEKNQGVGYLEDGTLVVVENAGNLQGRSVKVEFTRNLQTTAGRMMFARKLESAISRSSNQRSQTPAVRMPKTYRPPRQPKTAEDKLISTIENQG